MLEVSSLVMAEVHPRCLPPSPLAVTYNANLYQDLGISSLYFRHKYLHNPGLLGAHAFERLDRMRSRSRNLLKIAVMMEEQLLRCLGLPPQGDRFVLASISPASPADAVDITEVITIAPFPDINTHTHDFHYLSCKISVHRCS